MLLVLIFKICLGCNGFFTCFKLWFMNGPSENFTMSHPPLLSSRFPVGFGRWHDILECNRLDLTAVLSNKRNVSICSYYLNVRWLVLPKRYIISFSIPCGSIITHNTNCHVNLNRHKTSFMLIYSVDFFNIYDLYAFTQHTKIARNAMNCY